MKVNVKLSLSDEERNIMAVNISGKDSKRMVTRAEVNEFVQGCMDCITDAIIGQPVTEMKPAKNPLSSDEQAEVERLRAMGKSDSYIRGWLQVGRSIGR